jgi:DNA-directed RNA polymerase specialized sigma subunit
MNMREIGKVIDLSESRVSQIHTDAMTRITDRMLAMGPRAVLGE